MKIYVGRSVRCGAFLILTTKNKQVMEYVPYIQCLLRKIVCFTF